MAKNQGIRVLIGTRKGAYVAESDARRKRWQVRGPYHPGREVFHVAADPRHEDHLYALVNSSWWGPMVSRSTNGGRKWSEIATPMIPRNSERTPPGPEGPPKRPIENLWHIEPGPTTEPKSLFLGVDPGSLYRSDDLGASWTAVPGLNDHPTRPQWNPGAGGMCVHTILIDPTRPRRMYVGISAAGSFRSDDGGEHWTALNRGVKVSFMPEKYPEVGQCVHHMALDPARPETVYRQDHDGVYVSRDSAEKWTHIGQKLPYDFGFVVAAPESAPGTAYFVPLHPQYRITMEPGLQVWRWTEKDRRWTPSIRRSLGPGNFGLHREGFAADRRDPFGLYLGTTTGELFYTSDGARNWGMIPYHFPSIHSVSVQDPAG